MPNQESNHWRAQLIGGPLDGEWLEGHGLWPAAVEETIDGVTHTYVLDIPNQRAVLSQEDS